MRLKVMLLAIFFMLNFYSQPVFAENKIIMGYRTNARLPLINEAPDSSGIYLELYQIVTNKLGYQLEVIRLPKKRVILGFQKGEVDFYPGFNFTIERSAYTFYIENGLPGDDIGISRMDFKEITNVEQLKGHTLLGPAGGPNYVEGIDGVHQYRISELTIDKAILLVTQKKRFDFYIYNRSSIEYYLSQHRIPDIKIHYDCCGGYKPMYLGFSRKSSLIKEIENPDFDPNLDISYHNFPVILSKDCFAYKFMKVLKKMQESGETLAIYNKYHGIKK